MQLSGDKPSQQNETKRIDDRKKVDGKPRVEVNDQFLNAEHEVPKRRIQSVAGIECFAQRNDCEPQRDIEKAKGQREDANSAHLKPTPERSTSHRRFACLGGGSGQIEEP